MVMPHWTADWKTFAVLGVLLVSGMLVGVWFRGRSDERRRAWMLGAVTVTAVVVLFGVTAWLIAPGAPLNGVEAVRSAALASGAVLAFYALWLNDQRRRIDQDRLRTEEARRDIEDLRRQVEEDRLRKEREQLEYERGHALEDRFAKAVELLGHIQGQTRIGALTMLAGVAYERPERAREVVDQFCAYLRWPIESTEESRGQHARFTAQRLLVRVLSELPFDPPPAVDLTGAYLVNFTLPAGTKLTELRLDNAELDGKTTLAEVKMGVLSLVDTRVSGELDLKKAEISDLLIDGRAQFEDAVDLRGTRLGPGRLLIEFGLFHGNVRFGAIVIGEIKCHAHFRGHVDFTDAVFRAGHASNGTAVLLDLSRAQFAGMATLEDLQLDGAIRLEGAVFRGGLVLQLDAGVWADRFLIAEDSEFVLPSGWRTVHSSHAGLLLAVPYSL